MSLRLLVRIALLSALATLVMWVETRLPFLPSFLKYDPSDAVALLGTLSMGPVAGLLIEVLKNILKWLLSGGAPIGYLANFAAGGTLVLVTGLVSSPGSRLLRQSLGTLAGCLAMAAVMIPGNVYLFLPAHGITGAAAVTLTLSGLVPFNLFKAAISGVLALVLITRLATALGQRDLASGQ